MIDKKLDKKKVVLGMSGGVDSSVTAYLLIQQGFEVIGVTLNHKQEKALEKEAECAKEIADILGIKHRMIDIEELFRKEVSDNFVRGYDEGMTPSPCIICDERVKMKTLLDVANEENAYYIATGHYCEIEYNKEFQQFLLKIPRDRKKDQSYMLYRLESDKLERIIFPLYEFSKEEIREIARNIGLKVSEKKDSQGICFAKSGYIDYLQKNLKDRIKVGNFVNEKGEILGQHKGYQLYTLGQRRGLGLKLPRAYFIIEIRKEKNEIVLGEYSQLYKDTVLLSDYKEIVDYNKIKDRWLVGKPRFSSGGILGKILKIEGNFYFKYKEENPQNAPGQHLVIYDNDYVVGGGMIEKFD